MTVQSNNGFFELDLPTTWKRRQLHAGRTGFLWDASPDSAEEVRLGRFVLPRTLDDRSKQALRAMLNTAHELSTEETEQLRFIISGFPVPTEGDFFNARTELIAGLHCVVFERNWLHPERHALELIVDATSDGTAINHFFFAAPRSQFDDYLPTALAAFSTLRPEST